MVNPFDLRAILVEKHAQHVVLIHFPIALFIVGVLFDLLSRGKRDSQLAAAAYLNLSAAAAAILPTYVTGVLAWQFALQGGRLRGLILLHFAAASLAVLLVIVSWWMHWRARKSEPSPLPRYRIPIELLGVAIIAFSFPLDRLAARTAARVSGNPAQSLVLWTMWETKRLQIDAAQESAKVRGEYNNCQSQ